MYIQINHFKSENSDIQNLIDLHISVGQNIWPSQDFVVKTINQYYCVFPAIKRNEKLGTIYKNGTEFEFPRVALNTCDRDILRSDGLTITDTWSTTPIPQVKISGLTTQKNCTHKAILASGIGASMRRHSKF